MFVGGRGKVTLGCTRKSWAHSGSHKEGQTWGYSPLPHLPGLQTLLCLLMQFATPYNIKPLIEPATELPENQCYQGPRLEERLQQRNGIN